MIIHVVKFDSQRKKHMYFSRSGKAQKTGNWAIALDPQMPCFQLDK
jgi:hypothetical protein